MGMFKLRNTTSEFLSLQNSLRHFLANSESQYVHSENPNITNLQLMLTLRAAFLLEERGHKFFLKKRKELFRMDLSNHVDCYMSLSNVDIC